MRIGPLDTQLHPLVIAEIGNNHEGHEEVACRMIDAAAKAGADIVKFQTYRTEHYVSVHQAERFARLKQFELSYAIFEHLGRVARDCGVVFLSTPLDLESAAFLNDLVPAFKIASGDNTFRPLIECVAGFDKPVLLSAGIATYAELCSAAGWLRAVWDAQGVNPGLAVLHCVTAYPAPPDQVNLAVLSRLGREIPDITVGYSDHTLGIEAAVLAVALGARIVEKHFTLDHHYSDFRDHQLSAEPRELADLVRRVRAAAVLLGRDAKEPGASEQQLAPQVRRSVVAARDLPAGTMLAARDITWVRPAGGLPPGAERALLGRRLRTAVAAGDLFALEMMEA